MKIDKLQVVTHDDKNYKLLIEATFPIEDEDLDILHVQRAVRANRWLIEQVVGFRRWDQYFDYMLMSKLFATKADYFKKEGHLVRSEKTAKKMLELSLRFKKLANEECAPKHLQWTTKVNKREDVEFTRGGLVTTYKINNKMGMSNEDYCRKMMKIANRIESEIENNYLKDTMAMLAKYWPTFWD